MFYLIDFDLIKSLDPIDFKAKEAFFNLNLARSNRIIKNFRFIRRIFSLDSIQLSSRVSLYSIHESKSNSFFLAPLHGLK
jgi:hypothetical protein